MSQDLFTSLTTSKNFSLNDKQYFEYSTLCDECPFLSQIPTLMAGENSQLHILQFGQSLHSLFQQKKDFAFLESLNIIYVLAAIFKFMNGKKTESGILVPSLSDKKIYYFGGMIKTSMYLNGMRKNQEKESNEKEKNLKFSEKKHINELETNQIFFLVSLLHQLLTKKKPKLNNEKLEEINYFNNFPLKQPIIDGLKKIQQVQKLEDFIQTIKDISQNFSSLKLSFKNEDHLKFQDYSLEILKLLANINKEYNEKKIDKIEFVRDSLFFGYACISVRRSAIYYALYYDQNLDFITNKWIFECLLKLAMETVKLERFYDIYFLAAKSDKNNQYEKFVKAIRPFDTEMKDLIEKYKNLSKKKDRNDILNHYLINTKLII